MKFCCWLLLLGIVWSTQLVAQPFATRNLSLQQGLPEYFVSGLVQDNAGFIWVATRDGLARYDGRQFNVFRHQPFGNRSLANNIILSLESISDTTLLIHFENNTYQLFNPVTEQFTDLLTARQFEQRQVKIAQATLTDGETRLWGRHEAQFAEYNRQTGQFITYPFPRGLAPGKLYPGNSFLLDARQQQLYAPFPEQLVQFDSRTHKYNLWPHPLVGKPGQGETYYGTKLIQRVTGEILLGAAQQLLLFNPKIHRFRTIPIVSRVNTQVGLLYEATDRTVYFTHGMTVYRLSPNDQITPIWTAPRIDYQNYFQSLLVDRSGVLWIGTNGDGIQQIDLKALPITAYPYRHTLTFVKDVLAHELGWSVPDWMKTTQHIYQLRLDGRVPYVTISLANSYQLLRGDSAQRSLQTRLTLPPTKQLPGVDGGNAIRVLPDGTVWMYDPARGLLKATATGQLLTSIPVPIPWVSSLQPVGNRVWLGSEEAGLFGFDLKTRRLVQHLTYQPADSSSLPSTHVLCMVADPVSPTVLWVGTQEGLGRLDTRTMRCRNWTQKQGLPSATIQTLLTDGQGNLWFSTGAGISRMNPRTFQLRHFTTADGLQDVEYKQNHALELPDGRLAFGGATGITVFDPLALNELVQPIPTVLTGLRVANVPVEPGLSGSPLVRPLNATQTLRLSPTQNFFSVEFAGLQYNKPASLQYRYKLTGVDADWVAVGNQAVANYTQLAPGTYEFRVNAANAPGNWSPLVKTIQIVIDPPWWQTGWAYAVYALLVLVLARAYLQYRSNQAQLQQEVALKEQEARLIQQNADWQTRFFTNITHEFRTPLTLILGPAERLMEPGARFSPASLQQQSGVIYRNTQRLLRLINQLLDIAKLEAGQLVITQSQGNLPAFIAQLVDSFRLRADKKGIGFTYESTGLLGDYRFDAHKLESIGYNLLANAVKFTPPGGQIRVHLNPENFPGGKPGFELQVSDTGVGIPPEQLPHIFDRFFQGQPTDASPGTGIGLFLVAEFSNLLGGSVSAESQPGQGTTFTVKLPLEQGNRLAATLKTIPVEPLLDSGPETERPEAPAMAPLVLVVEDNDELRDFIADELASTYRVLTAANGHEGWQLCLTELPELVISDVMMPVQTGPQLDGFTLVERIKTTPLTAHIAVILLTAKTMTDSRIQGLSVGANDYLTKPFNVRELQLRIGNLLAHQQQLRQHWQEQLSQLGAEPIPASGGPLLIDDPFLRKLYDVLDTQLANSAFSIEQLADELAVSPRTLRRKVSTLTGSNAAELMRSFRLQMAASLLQTGSSVAEATEKTGFESVPHFSRSFKTQFGVSPSAYASSRLRP